jgi:hypothetical protein
MDYLNVTNNFINDFGKELAVCSLMKGVYFFRLRIGLCLTICDNESFFLSSN